MSNKIRSKKRRLFGTSHRSKSRKSLGQYSGISQIIQTALDLQKRGYFQQAERYYREALATNPADPTTNNLLGNLYQQTGNIVAAVPYFQNAIQAKPDFVEAHANLGLSFCLLGWVDDAIAVYCRLLILNPDLPDVYRNFSLLMDMSRKLPDSIGSPSDRKKILVNCLSRTDLEPQNFFNACLNELFTEETLEEVHNFINMDQDHDLFLHFMENPLLCNLLSERLSSYMLKKTVVEDHIAEVFFTRLRKALAIILATQTKGDKFCRKMTPITCAIAHQCFWNEYVWQTTEEEEQFLLDITDQLKNERSSNVTSKNVIFLALLACYGSLGKYKIPEKLLKDSANIEGISELIQIHILEPGKERELSKSIPSFSGIKDEVSQKVKQQYEENPYPRWTGTFLAPPIPFINYLRQDIAPNIPSDLQNIAYPEVLIAGCGTGRQPLTCAMTYLHSSVTAIDLSMASLAYAKRKALELGINNIQFMQGDILEIHNLERKFDIIECTGVLHHMDDPGEGFRRLTALLKPAGFMRIGLYSELARQNVVAARNFINDNGFASTLEEIRKCRQALFALPDDNVAKQVTIGKDFYSTSTVRDLIFHIQEHRFTLLEISELLKEQKLEFLGFTLSMALKNAYISEHSDDPTATSLPKWHEYETAHPIIFGGMYNFWVRKI